MKDIYDLLPIYTVPVFEHQEILIEDLKKQNEEIVNDEDLFNSNFYELEASGIFDTILNIGKKLLGAIGPISKTVGDVGKVINSSSEVYHAVKDFKKPKKPTPLKKFKSEDKVEETVES